METHLRATECYLPPDTGERALPQPLPDRSVLDLPTSDGRNDEMTLVSLYTKMVYLSTDSHPSRTPGSNHVRANPNGSWTHDLLILSPTP